MRTNFNVTFAITYAVRKRFFEFEPDGVRGANVVPIATEAIHLAAMPKENARRALISTLDLVSGRSWSPSEAERTASRLVCLLPEQREGATPEAGDIAGVRAQRTYYWLVWVFIAMAISILSLRQALTADPGISTSAKSGIENITPPVSGDQAVGRR